MTEEEYIKIISEKDNMIEILRKENELLKQQNHYYKEIACTDSLTSLGNRRSLEKAEEYDIVILGDIDHFKKINDEHGHIVGDIVLVEISNIFKNIVRNSDLVCRWGGEEFVVLLKNCNDEDAYKKANQLKEEIIKLGEKLGFRITMSFGISRILDKTLKDAIDEADKAMYRSKENGRNRVTIYSLTYDKL